MSKSTRIFELVHLLSGRRSRSVGEIAKKLDAAIALAEESPRTLQLAPVDRSGPQATEALEPLRLAIQKRQAVEIEYHSLSGGKKRWRGIDPWQVFQRSEAWYLVGHCHENSEPRAFRLDRIGGGRRLKTIPAPVLRQHRLARCHARVLGRRVLPWPPPG